MDNGEENDPGTPGTVPSAEAARSGGRRQALRQRSAAVQDQVSRRREELERSRHVGLLLLAQRRFKAIEGGELSVLIALSLFVAMVPVVLLCFSWLTGFSSSANLASLIIRHYSLHEPVAGIVRDTFASASADRSASSVLGVASWAVAGFPLAVSVQKTFARAWRVPMLPWMASYLRGGLWFLLYVATQFGVEAAKWTLGHNLGLGVLAGLAPCPGSAAGRPVLWVPGGGQLLPGPVLLLHHPDHDRLRQPGPGRQPGPDLRRRGDADRAAVPGDGGGQGGEQLATRPRS